MSDNIFLIKKLIDYVESFEKELGGSDIKEFSIYLKDKLIMNEASSKNLKFDSSDYSNYKSYPEVEFSTMLTGLYRYAKHYTKKAFLNTSFKTVDEFGFLATLLKEQNLLKNELINIHLLEISSGSEILKRLIKNKLVYEYPDENDKRAKRVSLTEQGRREIFVAFDYMHKVAEIVTGNLSDDEMKNALSVFSKLTYFHKHIHENDRNSDLIQVHKKYVVKK